MKRICLSQSGFVTTIVVKYPVMLAVLFFFAAIGVQAQVPDNTYYPVPKAKAIDYSDTNLLEGDFPITQPDSLEEEIYFFLEENASFPGGKDAMDNFFQANLHYPQIAREKGIQGRVLVSFVVEKDGSISHVRLLRDIGGGCGEEAVRIVQSMPKWNPGKMRGEVVRNQGTTSIKFELPKE